MGAREVDPERFVPVLDEMRELLLKHEFIGQATVVADLIDHAHLESPDFVKELRGGDVWGSAGSVADVVFEGNVEGPEEEIRQDDIRFAWLLVRLAEELRAQGVGTEWTEQLARALRKDLERGN